MKQLTRQIGHTRNPLLFSTGNEEVASQKWSVFTKRTTAVLGRLKSVACVEAHTVRFQSESGTVA